MFFPFSQYFCIFFKRFRNLGKVFNFRRPSAKATDEAKEILNQTLNEAEQVNYDVIIYEKCIEKYP